MDDEKVAKCIDLYNSGLSLVAVSNQLGIDQSTVRRALLSAGASRRPVQTRQLETLSSLEHMYGVSAWVQ